MINKLLGSSGWEDENKSVFGATDVGKERTDNEDYFRIVPEKSLYIVADGMGGHNAGDIASLNASQMVDTYFTSRVLNEIKDDDDKIREAVVDSLMNAHRGILRMAKSKHTYEGMGCTLVLAFIWGNRLHLGHVGDARAYLCSESAIELLTIDHSFVMELVKKGKMTLEEARLSPLKNRLNQAIGASSVEIKPSYCNHSLKAGDRILLCSDGLWDMLTDEQLHQVVMQNKSAQKICETLVTMANQAGGHDNITAVVIIYKKSSNLSQTDEGKQKKSSGEYSFVFKE